MALLGRTKAAIMLIWNEFKNIGLIFGIASHALTIGYLIITLFTNTGLWYVNGILLTLAVVNAAFAIYFELYEKSAKKLKKTVSAVYKWSKRTIKLFTLGITFYGLFLATTNLTPLSLISPILIAVAWLLDVLIAIICMVIEAKLDYILEAITADLKHIPLIGKEVQKLTHKGMNVGQPSDKLEQLNEMAIADNEDWHKLLKSENSYKKERRKEKTKLFLQNVKKKFSKKENPTTDDYNNPNDE